MAATRHRKVKDAEQGSCQPVTIKKLHTAARIINLSTLVS